MRLLHALLNLGPFEPLARRCLLLASPGLLVRTAGRTPRRGPLLVAASHPRAADISLVAAAVWRPLEFTVVESHLGLPVIGRLLRIRGAHALALRAFADEEDVARLEAAAHAIRGGAAVAIFPEGRGEGVHGGVARLAALAGAPVLPVLVYASRRRALVALRRPLAPPAGDARSRRAFRLRLARRLRTAGALRAGADAEAVLRVLSDDPRRWRDPRDVIRLHARVRRLEPARAADLARIARAVERGCARLRCSPADLARPPGPRDAAAFALLAPLGVLHYFLCGTPHLVLRRLTRSLKDNGDRRGARAWAGLAMAAPWSAVLAGLGLWLLGPAGLLLPPLALASLLAQPAAKAAGSRVRCARAVRRRGARLAALLRTLDAAVRAAPRRRARHAA